MYVLQCTSCGMWQTINTKNIAKYSLKCVSCNKRSMAKNLNKLGRFEDGWKAMLACQKKNIKQGFK